MLRGDSPEGTTPIDENDIDGLLPGHIATQNQLNEWESANILKASNRIPSVRGQKILTERFVRELHHMMFDETWKWAGQYRHRDMNIGIHWPGIREAVVQLCQNAIVWRDDGVFIPEEAAVRIHHRLVQIHPFPNGNGRHARLFADLYLIKEQSPNLTWGNVGRDDSTTRKKYLSALRLADKGEFSELLHFCRAK